MAYTKQQANELLSTVRSNAMISKKSTKTKVSKKSPKKTVVDKTQIKKIDKSKEKKPKDDVTAKSCKGKTVKGTACTRKGIHDGYCYQHTSGVRSEGVKKGNKSTAKVNKPGKKSYRYRISRSIIDDEDKKGSSRQAIKKYLEANFKIEKKDYFRVNSTLKKMLESGEIIKNPKHQGHYRLSPEFKKTVEGL